MVVCEYVAGGKEMNRRVVIVHEQMGIFVGAAVGFAFWSMTDAAGQHQVATFSDEVEARNFVRQWSPPQDPDSYRYLSLFTSSEGATVEELVRVGLSDYTRLLLLNLPHVGHA
jgi:hypothetical protein